jgi:CRP/FNR family transcriptional regulator
MTPVLKIAENCSDCPIRHRAVCSKCEGDELLLLERIKSYKTYAPGDVIVWAETDVTHLGSVVMGVASINRTMEDGRRQLVGLLLPSDFIGRPGRDMVPYDIVAVTEVTVCHFHKAEFENMLASTPAIGSRLLELTLDELDAAREWMLLLGRKTAREKVTSFIAMLVRRALPDTGSVAEGITITLPLTRVEIGDFLGLTLETTSRQISALKKDGIVELRGAHDVHIPDLVALFDETGSDNDGGLPA